ncbi:CheR family methyltransferase [Alteribacillus bidgolensis]|uniref:protein-glutamate O-methyltransferase n=1 Tax=Alteribacillus bidgolensis TaxID=930129 RepID=A0A1G8C5T8_9BACI|nr:protein-glutamate O-methyltransferase CheR [Alteribacillus bidgolensis]SDH40639.1 chemotaxis protein methyltransferase CheR [Alteribacillus bidgolensis]
MQTQSKKHPHKDYINNDYTSFVHKVKKKTGIDLSMYKEAQMKRRLRSFFEKKEFSSFEDFFYNGINKDEDVLAEFLERMTINVSEFLRNPKRWEILTDVILPRLLKDRSKLKVWSAACSTGEEPYTLSIILDQYSGRKSSSILATDIDEAILLRAKTGFYTEKALKELSKDMLLHYFIKETSGYRVKDTLRNGIRFKKHNLLADMFETGFDLIVCRNVLIYFTEEAKHNIYKEFNKALNVGGVLFVGSTEQIFNPARYGFEAEDTFFYKKINKVE